MPQLLALAAAYAFAMAASARQAPLAKPVAKPPVKPAAEIAPYPPMHWHSWNTFCAEGMVNDANMREMADALITDQHGHGGRRYSPPISLPDPPPPFAPSVQRNTQTLSCATNGTSLHTHTPGYNTVNVVCNGWTGRDPVTHVLQVEHAPWELRRPCESSYPAPSPTTTHYLPLTTHHPPPSTHHSPLGPRPRGPFPLATATPQPSPRRRTARSGRQG